MLISAKRKNDMMDITTPVDKRQKNDTLINADDNQQNPDRTSGLNAPNMLLSGHEGHVFAARFSPSGKALASASVDKRIFFWNVFGHCENFLVLNGHQSAVLDLAWSADSKMMYSAGADKVAIIWNLDTGERIKKIRNHKSYVNSVASSPATNEVFVTGSDDGTAILWDTRTRGAQLMFHLGLPIMALSMSKSGTEVFVGSIDPRVHMWDLRSSKNTMSLEGHGDSVTGVSVSPDGSYLLTNSMDNTVRCFDIRPFCPTARCIKTFYGATHDYEKNLLRCSWSADGSRIAAGSADRFVHIWDFNTTKILYKLPGHKGSVNDVQFHPTENIVASASSDRRIFMGELN